MQEDNQKAIEEIVKSIALFVEEALKKVLKNYDGIIVSPATNNKWNVAFNGETHALKPHGEISPSVGKGVKVFVPDGNMSEAYFI